jgi:hypothetical protein
MKTLSKTIENFLTYSFKGDGKYYTIEQGSKAYKNTDFTNFISKNTDCVEIIEKGNDTPRGGKTGNFVTVKFTSKFYEKFQFWFDAKEIANQNKIELQKIEGENDLLIKDLIVKHSVKINEWIEKHGDTSKGGRTVAWKCQKLSGFENFTVGQIYRNT